MSFMDKVRDAARTLNQDKIHEVVDKAQEKISNEQINKTIDGIQEKLGHAGETGAGR